MPLYEYECTKCGHVFEVIQKFSDPPRISCPRCKGKLRKKISAPAIHFKGSGWYVTDYGGRKGGGESESKESSRSESKESSKSESKSESTTKPSESSAPAAKDSGRQSGRDSGKESGGEQGKK